MQVDTTDKILISEIDCMVAIGVTPEERARKQRLFVDVEYDMDARQAAKSDSIRDAIDYSKVAAAVADVCQSQPFHLVETGAERIAERILTDFPAPQVRVLVRKISPVANPGVAYASVEIRRP